MVIVLNKEKFVYGRLRMRGEILAVDDDFPQEDIEREINAPLKIKNPIGLPKEGIGNVSTK